MQNPMVITWRGVRKTPGRESLIREEMAKVERVCRYITSAKVAVERAQAGQRSGGSPWRIRIDLRIPPGHEIVERRESGNGDEHETFSHAVRAAFHSARRQVAVLSDRQRREVKSHPEQSMNAVVVRIFHDRGYGFVRSVEEDMEVYFHRNSVVNGDYGKLTPGTGVRVTWTDGDKGPQATSLRIVDRPGERAAWPREAPAIEPPLGW